ncbi:MAG: hypothetical protein GTO22_26400 [Gemmatimonadales bacterium]|nr:hypothetical protein [Gemmatimonadales bacterium]
MATARLQDFLGTSGEALGDRKAVRENGSGQMVLVAADGLNRLAIGFTQNSTTGAAEEVGIQTNGVLGGFSGLTVGATYYLDQSTAGEITATRPGSGEIQVVGIARSATELEIAVAFDNTASPRGYIECARLAYGSASSVTVGIAGQTSLCRDSTNDFDIEWSGVLTGNMPADLDTGAEAADSWYAVFVIADSTGTNPVKVLFSLSATAPTMPAGYDRFRRVGYVRNDGSSNFYAFFQAGNGPSRTIIYEEPVATLRVLTNGSATTFTNVDCSGFIPPIGRVEAMFQLTFDNSAGGGSAGNDLRVRPGDSTLSNSPPRLQPGSKLSAAMQMPTTLFTDTNQVIQYQVSHASNVADIIVYGYRDDL